MKKLHWPKFTSEVYKEAGYCDEIITNIECWESQHPSVEDLLTEYRYVQHDGELFSEHSLRIIIVLYNMERMLENQRELTHTIERKLGTLVKLFFKKGKESSDDFSFDGGDF